MLNKRTLKALQISTALPAAAANNNSSSLDSGTDNPGRTLSGVEILLEVPATPSLVDAKTIIYTFQDSADNSSWAAVPDLPTITSLGAGGVGAAAVERYFKPPITLRRYLRVNQAVLTAGGDSTAISSTLSFVE